ncbi:MAG: isocitrate/isopropylmalate dehydrogenase family protein [Bradymonadales bacterium]|nr:isocitrate/isopropylmalate dehydrogenase family protein [Bradymonadales bacterium]
MAHKITLLPGDATTAELVDGVIGILAAVGAELEFERQEAGRGCFERCGSAWLPETLASIEQNRLALKGGLLNQPDPCYPDPNRELWKRLGLFAVVSPIRNLPGLPARHRDVDLVIIREATEDLHVGLEDRITETITTSLKVVTAEASERISRFAFEYARCHGREKITLVHKANIMKVTDGLFIEVFRSVASGYPDIGTEQLIVDNAAMQLVMRPHRFDVLLMGNLYGDILADLALGIVGGTSTAMSMATNEQLAVFEALHGDAPHSRDTSRANPLPMLLPACYLLEYLGQEAIAQRIVKAVGEVLQAGVATPDLGGSASTAEMIRAIMSAL